MLCLKSPLFGKFVRTGPPTAVFLPQSPFLCSGCFEMRHSEFWLNAEIFTQAVVSASRAPDGTTAVLGGAGRRASTASYRVPSAPIRGLRRSVPRTQAWPRNSNTSPTTSTLRLPAGRVPRLFLFARSARRRVQAILPRDGNRSRGLCRPLVPGRVTRQLRRRAVWRKRRAGKRDRAYQRGQQ